MRLESEEGRYYLYILTNKYRERLDIQVTGDWTGKLLELEYALFNNSGNCDDYSILLYWEDYEDPLQVIKREQEIKSWSRRKKNDLIDIHNPGWRSLNEIFNP